MTATMTRDLFTALYNRDLNPGQYHSWFHIRNIYAAAGITLNIYNADSTSTLTCSKLQGVKKAFRAIYANTGSMGEEASFATFFNQYYATSYTYSDIINYANACGVENYNPLQAEAEIVVVLEQEEDPQPGSVLPVAILLCGRNEPYKPPVTAQLSPCDYLKDMALQMATEQYRAYLTQQYNLFDNTYLNKCLEASKLESFTVEAPVAEYHYTLYYYNQAGNLVKTVPPAGANPNFTPAYLASVKAARENGTTVAPPAHTLITQYRYNTLGQVVAQHSPDGGTSHFWYDALGRLVVSQNAKQKLGNLYSFTQYDALGRITEVGEKMQSTAMEPSISQDPTLLSGWMGLGGSKKQVTKTVYDEPYNVGNFQTQVLAQRNLRNRVSYTYVQDDESVTAPDRIPWQAATLYSYDIHGNVDVLVQDFKSGMGLTDGNRWKRMEYQYDLISGKVNEVAYQPGRIDGFYHRYDYDAENKLTKVYTSRDKLYWERDATYEYYRHGPLARTVLGQRQVQGVDYGYTLQGWLKGVNSHSRTLALYDMGQDGRPSLRNGNVARDVYGYSLNYHPGDYKAISSAVAPWATGSLHNLVNSDLQTVAAPLYNGNIASMMVSIPQLGLTQLYGYQYDQLNRIVSMDAFSGMNNDANSFTAIANADYKERVSYDPNGNILSYWRNGAAAANGTAMDKLTYQYPKDAAGRLLNNRLRYVHDEVSSAYTDDIDSQTPLNLTQVQAEKLPEQAGDNYTYDAIGNLLKDTKEGIANISWNVYGKIAEIQRNGTAENPVTTIKYTYDAAGNRIGKTVWKLGDVLPTNTYYVRDASGNVMGIYESGQSTGYNLTQKEVHLYGSSRLGILNTDINVQSGNLLVNNTGTITFTRGNKFFELSNHLGNVLATISDKKIPVSGNGTWVDWYMADVVTANDYYPGGMVMPGRKYSAANAKYRYGFNGKENDNEVKGDGKHVDYGWRVYDPRLVRFLSVDPLQADYPELTTYQFAGNTPIQAVDLDGREIYHFTLFFPSDGRPPILTYLGEQKNKPCEWLCDPIDKGKWDGFKTYGGDEITDFSIQFHVIAVEGQKSAYRPAKATVTFDDFIEAWKWTKAGYPGTEDEIAFVGGFQKKLEGGTFVASVTTPSPSPAKQPVAARQSPSTNTAKQATAVNGKQLTKAEAAAVWGPKALKGSGTVSGVIELSSLTKSSKTFSNGLSKTARDFVYDPTTQKFAMAGNNAANLKHYGLRKVIGATEANVVGGRIKLGANGEILTSQWSGTYGGNWTSEIAAKFKEFIKNTTTKEVKHSGNSKFTDGTQ